MRSVIIVILFLFVCLSSAQATWEPTQRLTTNGAESWTAYCNAWCIATTPDLNVHIAYCDQRSGNFEIYYRWSTDNGVIWEPAIQLTDAAGHSVYPSICTSDGNLHVFWNDSRDGNYEIYYKRSPDGGTTWEDDVRLTSATGTSYQCSAAADGNSLHVVWEENRDGNYEIYTKSSDDGGDSWSADTRLTNQTAESRTPTVGVGGGNVHVVWTDARAGNFELHYLRSLDDGLNWDEPVRLTNNYAHSDIPSIAVLDNKVHIAWYDARFGDDEILYKRSEDFGTSWTADTNISQNSSDYSRWPSLAVVGDEVHVVWERWYGSYNIFYRRSTNGGVSWEPVVNLSGNSGDSWYASVATIGLGVHVVWMDTHHGNKEIYYRRQSPDFADVEWDATDSNQSESAVLTIADPLSLDVFPNPSQDDFRISWRSRTPVLDGARVEIYDATGRIVYETSSLHGSSGQLTWDRRDQSGKLSVSGVYLVRFQTNDVTVSQRVISLR